MFRSRSILLLLSGLALASSAQALVADGSQPILKTDQYHTGATKVLGGSTNSIALDILDPGPDSFSRIVVDADRNQFGALARATSTGSQVFASAGATYYEVVTFAAPAGGANIDFSVSIDGLFTAPTSSSGAGSEAWARGMLYVADVTGHAPFKDFGSGSFRVVDFGTNTTCVEISVRSDLAHLTSGCGNAAQHRFVEGFSQQRSIEVAKAGQLLVQDGHSYLFISDLDVSATAVGQASYSEADLMHTFSLQVQSLGGAKVLSANGPMFLASAVPEAESTALFVVGILASMAVKRRVRLAWRLSAA